MLSKCTLFSSVLTLTLLATALAQSTSPRADTVEPDTGKPGMVITLIGENLEKPNVAELFLTDGKNDQKAVIVEQAAKTIKFKIPADAKPGRYSVLMLTGGKEPKYLEQPVKVNVE